METLSEAQDDSSGANPSSVKSEDGSPPPDGDRSSPPPNCAICLGRCRNKSFTDSCLHQFCFKCLVTWSKVKTECPLCKQNFKSIIHNVQSNQQYEEYRVEQRLHEEEMINIDDLVTATRRFRYRTTLTFPRGGDHIALQRLLMHYPPLSAMVGMSRELPGIVPAALPSSRRRRSPSSFRRTVYRHNLWARPLPDFTGRHRDCTPEFYRYNDSQMHRLVPWLNRELHYLLLENAGHIAYVLQRILELLPQCHITSPEFRNELYRYFGSRTDHFLHELHCFASTPYDLTGYDRNVQYTTDSRVSNTVNDVLSSSDTESGSGDSDIMLVNNPPAPLSPMQAGAAAFDTNPGPSGRRLPGPVYLRNHIDPVDEARRDLVIPIETISHSDTDDDEVMVTGYIKPPHQRTPEVVDLRDSDDSDVVVTEGPSQPASSQPAPPRGHVKVMLSRARHPRLPATAAAAAFAPAPACSSASASAAAFSAASDSEDARSYTPPPPPPQQRAAARRRRSSSSYCPSSERAESPPTPSAATSSDSSASARRQPAPVKRNKRKRTRRSRDADRAALLAAPPPPPPAPEPSAERENDKRKKSKSTNGKGVKSSRKIEATPSSRAEPEPVREEPRAGPSSRPDAKSGRSSRKADATDSNTTESTSVKQKPLPESSCPLTPGNGWKSYKREDNSESRRAGTGVQGASQPKSSTSRSGENGSKTRKDEAKESQRGDATAEARSSSRAGPSGSSDLKRKITNETSARRSSRESKRLKSVVKKTSNWSSAVADTSSPDLASRASSSAGCTNSAASASSLASSASNSASPTSSSASPTSSSGAATSSSARPASKAALKASSAVSSKKHKRYSSSEASDTSAKPSPDFCTDSDDDIPLNLTIQRSMQRHS